MSRLIIFWVVLFGAPLGSYWCSKMSILWSKIRTFFRYLNGHIFIPGCAMYPLYQIECPDLTWTFDLAEKKAFYSHQIFIRFEGKEKKSTFPPHWIIYIMTSLRGGSQTMFTGFWHFLTPPLSWSTALFNNIWQIHLVTLTFD